MATSVSVEDPGSVAEVAQVLSAGGVAVIPTDTVYGMAARAEDPVAVATIFELKRRPKNMPLPVLVHSISSAVALGEFDEDAARYVEKRWPGPTTAVVPRTPDSKRLDIGGDFSSIGLRVPNHKFVLALLEVTGPLAATSANLTSQDTPTRVADIRDLFGDRVSIYVDGGVLDGQPSEVVSFTGERRRLR